MAERSAAQTLRQQSKPRQPKPALPVPTSNPATPALNKVVPGLVYIHQTLDLRPVEETLMTLDGEPVPPLLFKNVTLGVVVDAAGLIVTRLVGVSPNNPPLEVTVLGQGLSKPYPAKFLGLDSVTGLCVLKVEGAPFTPPQFAEPVSLPAQLAVKLKGFHANQGQSQFNTRPRIHTTEGRVIKAVKDFRYTPGNPFYQLADPQLTPVQDGSLVFEGENSLFGLAVYDTLGEGQSLVYPIARVLDIVAKVVKANESLAYGWLGATPDLDMSAPISTTITGQAKPELGVRVRAVFPDSPAELAGIKARDILLSLNDRRVESNAQLGSALRQLPPESEVTIRLKRDNEYKLVKAKLAPSPASEPSQMIPALMKQLETMKSRLNAMPLNDPGRATFEGKVETMDSILKSVTGPAQPDVRLRVFYGLEVQPLSAQMLAYFAAPNGLLVTSLNDKQRLAEGGLQAGDVIVKVGAQPVTDVAKLLAALDEGAGVAEVTVQRRRSPLTLKLTR
ncbi:MAG: PDZ domain-containing protein [Acidobacteria bacterium]|nr:PDZ domain-containing protein [Acidobacteriota bacterium]MBI3427361.1 PDZ domain-containing protein [Acidobacteriota bacterium]